MLVWGGQTRQKFSEIGTSKFSSLFLLFTRWKTAAKCRATVNEGQGERWERGGDEQRMIMILLCSLFTTRGAQNLCGKRFNFSSSCSSTTSFVGSFHICHYVFIKLRKNWTQTETDPILAECRESRFLKKEREWVNKRSNGINLLFLSSLTLSLYFSVFFIFALSYCIISFSNAQFAIEIRTVFQNKLANGFSSMTQWGILAEIIAQIFLILRAMTSVKYFKRQSSFA